MLNIIKYDNSNALEATWLDAKGKQIASIAYADSQIDLLRADVAKYGGDITPFEPLISEVEAAYVPPLPEPVQLSPLDKVQVRKVLTQFGLRQQVEDAVAAGSQDLKDEWNFRDTFVRDNSLLVSMATSLGITDAQLDLMFEAGALL